MVLPLHFRQNSGVKCNLEMLVEERENRAAKEKSLRAREKTSNFALST